MDWKNKIVIDGRRTPWTPNGIYPTILDFYINDVEVAKVFYYCGNPKMKWSIYHDGPWIRVCKDMLKEIIAQAKKDYDAAIDSARRNREIKKQKELAKIWGK